MKRIRADDLHKKWMKSPAYRREYEALAEEFALATALLSARGRAGLTQAQVARRMKTTQTAIARLEGGRVKPSTRTLERYARATGHKLVIGFEPVKEKKAKRIRGPNKETRRAIEGARRRKNVESFPSASEWAKKVRSA